MQNVFTHIPVVYVCNPYVQMYMSSVNVYMPAMQLYK